jgi:PhnB protein
MQISPYLLFDGNCAEAFRAYERILGGKITAMQTHGESPSCDAIPEDKHHTIMHACLDIDGMLLMASDDPLGYNKPQGFSVALGLKSTNEARRVFDALAEGGRVMMAFDRTSWSPGFGMVVDRFGTPWMINTVTPA